MTDSRDEIRNDPTVSPTVTEAMEHYWKTLDAQKTKTMTDRQEKLERALHSIVQWSKAYPLDVFPEPDWKKARALLEAGGISLDAVSAHCMRHVVVGVGDIAQKALDEPRLP